MASGHACQPRLIGLSDAGKRFVEIRHQGSGIVLPTARVLVERISHNVTDRLRVNEEPVQGVERAPLVELFECIEKVDDDLADLRYCLGLELGRKIVA